MGTKSKKIFESSKEKERTVELSMAYAAVTLLPPRVRKGEYDNKPIAIWCIRIWEAKPPPSVQPLEWVLLTYLPVETPAQAWTMTSYYECRFVVEEYHKAQKTGCQIEDLQFETAQALQPMIALLSVVATVLLNLRQACRSADADTRPATDIVAPIYEEVVRAHRYNKPRGPLTIKEFTMASRPARRPHEPPQRRQPRLANPLARLDQTPVLRHRRGSLSPPPQKCRVTYRLKPAATDSRQSFVCRQASTAASATVWSDRPLTWPGGRSLRIPA